MMRSSAFPHQTRHDLSSSWESDRLSQLQNLQILDSESEPELDDLVTLAAALCGTPISTITFIDRDRQWFKATKGLDAKETSREISFCDRAVRQSELFLVENAAMDDRFSSNPLVTGAEHYRFYAGMPIQIGDGVPIGTLCVIDRQPRTLNDDQRTALRVLSDQVSARLELRLKQRELETALEESNRLEQRFQRFMDSGPLLAYLKDENGRMLYYNSPFAKEFKVSPRELIGRTDAELWPLNLAASYREHDLSVLESGKLTILQERTQNENGSYKIWTSYKFPCPGLPGETLLGGISIDATDQFSQREELLRVQRELQQANLLLEEVAAKDALTGLATRRVFDEHLRLAFREAREENRALALLAIDIDDFKLHNDTYGHQHGDAVLQQVAKALSEEIRPSDLLARYGGEEFAVLMRDTTSSGATVASERLLKATRALQRGDLAITISIGIAELDASVQTTHDLLRRADTGLYKAKRTGKNRACLVNG